MAVCILSLGLHLTAFARGRFISAPARIDIAYDDTRSILYISNGGQVLRYNISSKKFLRPFSLGGNLYGMDISPDGNTLAVADDSRTADRAWIYLVDLRDGHRTKVKFPLAEDIEGGTYSVAYGSDGKLLITSRFRGSGWVPLRRYDPTTNKTTELIDIFQDSMLAASADRTVIGWEESHISDGPFGRYRVADGNILQKSGYDDGTACPNYEIAVNRNGTQYAIPTYGGTFICDSNLVKSNTVIGEYAEEGPISAVYSPTQDIVYFACANSRNVRAYNTNTLAPIEDYDFENDFDYTGNWAFQSGRLKMSRDGTLLFCTVDGGVRYTSLSNSPPVADSQSIMTSRSLIGKSGSIAITLSASDPDGDPIVYTVSKPHNGRLSGTAPNLVYTPNPGFVGKDSFMFTAGDNDSDSQPAKVSILIYPGGFYRPVTIAAAKRLPLNSYVQIYSVVVTAANLEPGVSYIASPGRDEGIKILTRKQLRVGQYVSLDGFISRDQGEWYLSDCRFSRIIGSWPSMPNQITSGQASLRLDEDPNDACNATTGLLVQVTGWVIYYDPYEQVAYISSSSDCAGWDRWEWPQDTAKVVMKGLTIPQEHWKITATGISRVANCSDTYWGYPGEYTPEIWVRGSEDVIMYPQSPPPFP